MALCAPEVIFFIRLHPCFLLFSHSRILIKVCDQHIDIELKCNFINGNGFEFRTEMEKKIYVWFLIFITNAFWMHIWTILTHLKPFYI